MDSEHKHHCGQDRAAAGGILWFIGWLFTIGFNHLAFWKAVLALLIWPYYLGGALFSLLSSLRPPS